MWTEKILKYLVDLLHQQENPSVNIKYTWFRSVKIALYMILSSFGTDGFYIMYVDTKYIQIRQNAIIRLVR